VRRRVQQHTHGHCGPPLYGIRRVRRAAEYLTTTAWARLLARIDSGVLEIGRRCAQSPPGAPNSWPTSA